MRCVQCGKPVSSDEAGLTKKLVNRGTTDYLCFDCLGEKFKLQTEDMQELIAHFRAMGCTLFL